MFRVERIHQTLHELSQNEEVGEIILIDNSGSKGPLLELPKLRYIREEKNIYVNPAWNKGAHLAKYDKLCFLSDDVWFDWKHLKEISTWIREDIRMIGMSSDNFEDCEIEEVKILPVEDNEITKKPRRPDSYACCFFMHKKNWIDIPEELKIWCGDDWLFYLDEFSNYVLSGIRCQGFVSFTSDHHELQDDFDPIKNNDMAVMKRLISEGKVSDYLALTWWDPIMQK
jgi:hypothetical protein